MKSHNYFYLYKFIYFTIAILFSLHFPNTHHPYFTIGRGSTQGCWIMSVIAAHSDSGIQWLRLLRCWFFGCAYVY